MSAAESDQAWVDGHRAGYAKGRDDGIGIGYSDAKLRAYTALEAVESVLGKPAAIEARRALETTLGKRA